MSESTQHASHKSVDLTHETPDTIEALVPLMPVVLPVCGGLLIFLLAWIAVYMA